jgi:hypothetical protein
VASVTTAQAVTLTAKAGSLSKTFALQLNAAVPTLSIGATTLAFGNESLNTAATQSVTLTSSGTAPVTISAVAVTGAGFTVSAAALPVTLNPGQAAAVTVKFDPTAAGAVAGQLTITSNSSTNATAKVALSGSGVGTAALGAVSCSSASEVGWIQDPCTVVLTAAAPSGGLSVSLSSSNAAVTLPASVTVPAGATSAAFTATVSWWQWSAQAVTLTASAGGVSKTFALQLLVAEQALTTSVTSISFGNLALNTAATQIVTLTSSSNLPLTISGVSVSGTGFTVSALALPVTLNPGLTTTLSVKFDPTVAGAATGQVIITSNASTSGTNTISLSGTGAATAGLSAVSCGSGTMTGAGSDVCTVTLNTAAPTGGLSVNLSSSSSAVTLPATVTVPAGATSAGFTATVSSVTTAQAVTLTATAAGASHTFSLQLSPSVPTLTIGATSLAFGDVALNTPATQAVTLTSTGSVSVTISGIALTGTGYTVSGATFPLTLSAGQAATLTVKFDPTVAGAATGQLTITSNSSTNGTAVIALSGTGGSTASGVQLSWYAPSTSDSIAGYNVYRSPSGSSTYQLLNSSCESSTTYTDNTVQSGQTYDYVVETVDVAGVESVPSNMIGVAVP